MEIIAECPFEHRKRCAELMSQLMIEAAKEHIHVPMKCDAECFFRWYDEDVDFEDTPETLKMLEEYCKEFDN